MGEALKNFDILAASLTTIARRKVLSVHGTACLNIHPLA